MEEEKKGFSKEEIIKLLAILLVLVVLFVYSVFSGNKIINKQKNDTIVTDVTKLFEPIMDNYELVIDKTVNEEESHIEFIYDGTFKLYNINNEKKGYLIYNDKTYLVELKDRKIKEYNKKLDFINDNYSNIEFIKKIIKHCDIKNEKKNEFDCNIKIEDYINEYNNYFYSNHKYDGDEIINFNIKHGSIVNNIIVDYRRVNQIIKGNSDNIIKYNILIKNVNNNDYSELFEIFDGTLKK